MQVYRVFGVQRGTGGDDVGFGVEVKTGRVGQAVCGVLVGDAQSALTGVFAVVAEFWQ